MAQEITGLIFLCGVEAVKCKPWEFSVTLFFATLEGKKKTTLKKIVKLLQGKRTVDIGRSGGDGVAEALHLGK